MNIWPRKLLPVLLIVIASFGVAVSTGAQDVADSDTEEVGLIVTWECPLLQTPEAEVADFASMASLNEFRLAQTGEDEDPPSSGPGSCPRTPTPGPDDGSTPPTTATATATATSTAEATETPVAVSTNSVGGFGPTVPVVAQLPDTGTSPEGATSHWMLATMLTAGVLLTVGGLLNSRTGQKSRGN